MPRLHRPREQFSGFYYKRVYGERLWQRFGYGRVLRNDEDTLTVARYIVENPIRARLTRSVSEYPFIGSEMYSLADILDAVQMSSNWRSS